MSATPASPLGDPVPAHGARQTGAQDLIDKELLQQFYKSFGRFPLAPSSPAQAQEEAGPSLSRKITGCRQSMSWLTRGHDCPRSAVNHSSGGIKGEGMRELGGVGCVEVHTYSYLTASWHGQPIPCWSLGVRKSGLIGSPERRMEIQTEPPGPLGAQNCSCFLCSKNASSPFKLYMDDIIFYLFIY